MFAKLQNKSVQKKIHIGQANDQYEKEANTTADQVMQMTDVNATPIQRQCEDCEEEALQMKPLSDSITPLIQKQGAEEEEEMLQMQPMEEEEEMLQMQPLEEEEEMLQMQSMEEEDEEEMLQPKSKDGNLNVSGSLSTRLSQTKGSGSKLPDGTNQQMSGAFGTDFSNVNIHTDSKAVQMNREIGARAFTHGNDLYFNKGEYNPVSNKGKHLLAHELTHVVQQGGSKKMINKKDPPSSGQYDIKLAAQKKMWEDLAAFFPDEARKLAGSGYDPGISLLKASFLEGKKGGVSHSAPTMIVGSSYTTSTDAVRKKKLEEELLKIDRYRVEKGRIDDKDTSNTTVNALIDRMNVKEKQQLISKMRTHEKYITNTSMREHVRKKMPSTSLGNGAVPTANGGFTYQFDNITIEVLPDVFNSPKVSSGGETDIQPVNQPTVQFPAVSWLGGKITKIEPVPPRHSFKFSIQTHYSAGTDPTNTSGYGVGTESGAKGEDTHLRKHEGAHGEEFVKHIQNNIASNKYPLFTGKVGDDQAPFQTFLSQYKTQVQAFLDMIKAAMTDSIQNVDCVGVTTIEDYYKGKGKSSPVTCKTP